MNGLEADLDQLLAMEDGLEGVEARIGICPPATLLGRASQALKSSHIILGGQDCRAEVKGAFTGDVSAEMLADAGASLVILGHSERRAGYGETDAMVANKVLAALRAGLEPIVCIGETLEQRRAGEALKVVVGQVIGSLPSDVAGRPFAVAYEPVWAIGTGLTPTSADIAQMHNSLRDQLISRFGGRGEGMRLIYGGSLKPANAKEILAIANVNGGLVGGASLLADDFNAIIWAV